MKTPQSPTAGIIRQAPQTTAPATARPTPATTKPQSKRCTTPRPPSATQTGPGSPGHQVLRYQRPRCRRACLLVAALILGTLAGCAPRIDRAASATPSVPEERPTATSASPQWFYPLVLWDTRLGIHDHFERLVMEFRTSDGTPRLQAVVGGCVTGCADRGWLEPYYSTFDGAGNELEIQGAAVLRVVVPHDAAAAAVTIDPIERVGPPDDDLPLHGPGIIHQVVLSDNTEGVVEVLITLTRSAPVQVFYLRDPERLVIDVWTGSTPTTTACRQIEVTTTETRCRSASDTTLGPDGDDLRVIQ